MLRVKILLYLMMASLGASEAAAQQPAVRSNGSLAFQCNGVLYVADSNHARGYSIKQTGAAYINGANKDNIVVGIEWNGVNGTGVYYVNNRQGKTDFTINHKTYSLARADDYLKITITATTQQGAFLLLSGFFEGRLHDKNGNEIKIINGRLKTLSI